MSNSAVKASLGHEFLSTKTYCHNIGLSCAFRQWRADSHCRFLHGYALKIRLEFVATELDVRNWVIDFGGMKSLKARLEDTFDHKTLVAQDDPAMDLFEQMQTAGVVELIKVEHTGCEAMAKLIFESVDLWLDDLGEKPRVSLRKVEVSEHEGNSAIYQVKHA